MTRIGSDALELDPQEQRQELSFPVTIQLDDQQLRLKSGSSLPLKVGMSLTANLKLSKVSYLQLLLGEFQDKAESLQRLGVSADPFRSSELSWSIRSHCSAVGQTRPTSAGGLGNQSSGSGAWHA